MPTSQALRRLTLTLDNHQGKHGFAYTTMPRAALIKASKVSVNTGKIINFQLREKNFIQICKSFFLDPD